MSAGGSSLIFLAQAKLRRRNLHPKHGITTAPSRDMASSIEPRLAKEALLRGHSRKRPVLARIKSIFEGRKEKTVGDKNRRELGLDWWDGFSWAEQRQDDGQRLKRVWDSLRKEWVVVQNLGSESSVGPCDMIMEEDWDIEISEGRKEESIHDSFYAAATSVGSLTEADSSRSSISGLAGGTDATLRANLLAAGPIQHTLCVAMRKDNNATVHPNVKAAEDAIKPTETSNTVIRESAQPSRPKFATKKKLISLRRTAIWNATRISGRKGFNFVKFRAGKEPNNEDERLLDRTDLNGISKLIDSIDRERVSTVRHIWHADTREWTQVRDSGTQTDDSD